MIGRIVLVVLTLLLLSASSFVGGQSSISNSDVGCHSEGAARPKNLAQGELREESRGPSLPLRMTAQQTENAIAIIASGVEVDFPAQAVFTLEAESSSDIIDVRLCYRVDKMKYAEVVSEGWASFSPATRIEAEWVWDMRNASLPPGAEITYWWTIEDTDGNTFETSPEVMCFNDARYLWQSLTSSGFLAEWQTYQGDALTIFWYEGDDSFARELMDTCEEGLIRLTEDIGTYPERPIKIYVYASTEDLRGAMVFPQEWTGGVAYTEFSIIAIGIPPARLDWGKRALIHELTHLVVHQATFGPYGRLPTWLDEGLAMYNEGELEPHFRSRLEEAISDDELISVRSLCSPFSAEPDQAYLSYAQSYSLVEYLLENHGKTRMLDLLSILKQGSTYDGALTDVYDFDMDGLDANWRATLSGSAVPGWRTWLHPVVIAVLGALATGLAVRYVLRKRTWRRSSAE